jgi:thiamine biosynthesis protein ThiI
VYGAPERGPGGLPVGTLGKGLLLLSGGIDSPVAGQVIAKRGMRLTAVHFHTPPYTSPEAHDKVMRLAAAIAPWCDGLTLYSVPFTDCQLLVKNSVNPSAVTLHSRAAMMKIAEKIALRNGYGALITGESLGQVASQTLESLTFTNSVVSLPVLRPLIGMDKEEIIARARETGTFETSIEPHADCCSLFSPERPVTRPDVGKELAVFNSMEELERSAELSLEQAAVYRFDTLGRLSED